MPRVLGIVNLHGYCELEEVTSRSIGATPLLGRYSIIDLALSNYSNSGISNCAVLVGKHLRALARHLNNSNVYTDNPKLGSTTLLYNEEFHDQEIYNTDLNNLIENKFIFEEDNFKYVIITPCKYLFRLNFNELLHQHEKRGSNITLVYKKINNADKEFIDAYTVDVDQRTTNKKIRAISVNNGDKKTNNIYLETLIINRDVLERIMSHADKYGHVFNLTEVIANHLDELEADSFYYEGYLKRISDLKEYLSASIDLLNIENLYELTNRSWPIYTKTHNTPPARYLEDADVSNSFISNGSIIEGKVINSIICRNVIIKKGAVIKNSIVFSGTTIHEGVKLENGIIDKHVDVQIKKEIIGTKERPVYIKKGEKI